MVLHGDTFETYDRVFAANSEVVDLTDTGATAAPPILVAPCALDILEAYWNVLTAGTGAASTSSLILGVAYTTPGVAAGAADTNYFASQVSLVAGASAVVGDMYRFGLHIRRILKGHVVNLTHVQLTNGGTGYATLMVGIPRVA
jgi:hypothetical protein